MKYIRYIDHAPVTYECDEVTGALCEEFHQTWRVERYRSTEGEYGPSFTPVTISESTQPYDPSEVTCVLEPDADGKDRVIACVCDGYYFAINGKKDHYQAQGPGSQGALIWEYKGTRMVKR